MELQSLFLLLLTLSLTYLTLITALLTLPNLQRHLIYLPYIRPATPPTPTLTRISNHTRTIHINNLSGWHTLPTGPPFQTSETHFSTALSAPAQRVFLFFHGTCGTRAFPSSRIYLLLLLSAHFSAHVITIDYSGFADSKGSPDEQALKNDAENSYNWIVNQIHNTSTLFIYGMSLGSFPALSLSNKPGIHGIITDSALSTLLEAVMTHPFAIPIRMFPYSRYLISRFLVDRLDNTLQLPTNTPWLILHAKNDYQIPFHHATTLFEKAVGKGCDVGLVAFDKVGHNNVATADGFLHALYQFIVKCEQVV